MKGFNTVEVSTKTEFVRLLHQLSEDFKNDPAAWENASISDYLDAMAGWVEDMDGYYLNSGKPLPKEINWNLIADIIIAARDYE